MLPALPGLFEAERDHRVAVLASGDPMFHGIGATLARVLGPERLRVLPHPSSVSLAAARLGWDLARTDVVSLVTAPVAALGRVVNPGRRILVLSSGADTPAAVAAHLTARGYPSALVTVLEQLGGPDERVVSGSAGDWAMPAGDPLNVIAVECGDGPRLPVVPGLPDGAYETDGQLTKREVRAVTLAALAPAPGELLWDVGAGSAAGRSVLPGGGGRVGRRPGRHDHRERRRPRGAPPAGRARARPGGAGGPAHPRHDLHRGRRDT